MENTGNQSPNPDAPPSNSSDASQSPGSGPSLQVLETWMHILPFAGFLIPFGNILAPLILWLLKKDVSSSIDRVGREVLSFQVSVAIYFLGFLVIAMIPILGWIVGILATPVVLLLALYVIYLMVKGTLASRRGEFFVYPWKIKLISDTIQSL